MKRLLDWMARKFDVLELWPMCLHMCVDRYDAEQVFIFTPVTIQRGPTITPMRELRKFIKEL
jgi:hypothetical protein